MPYIKQEDRQPFEECIKNIPMIHNAGELNYLITAICHQYLEQHGKSYQTLNDIGGVLTNANFEFYRIIVAAYEDTKIIANGPVDIRFNK